MGGDAEAVEADARQTSHGGVLAVGAVPEPRLWHDAGWAPAVVRVAVASNEDDVGGCNPAEQQYGKHPPAIPLFAGYRQTFGGECKAQDTASRNSARVTGDRPRTA